MSSIPPEDIETQGHAGLLIGSQWSPPADPTWVAVIAHGYGEHVGRYQWVAERLTADGAVVYAHDHIGHGRSEGERVLVDDFEGVVDDLHLLVQRAHEEQPDLPLVLIGHSMGGMIAARYTQRHPETLTATVLSGPVLGSWEPTALADLDEIPPTPIDITTLSREPDVGRAYEADELVWHGDFKRPTLLALRACLEAITRGGRLTVPTIWLHGADDQLVPIDRSDEGWAHIAPDGALSKRYPGARHEIFNETNREEVLDDVLAFVHEHIG
ncbi:alpha/beta hydrolase [Janibacter indicus]|uniref:Lysophospholipase, alpha-beta hydrolase superfamily n=1 Tax=Janibacter indicus TaxID=857417 RepID=A0A1W2AXB1_9MICO|nr:alpha/beta hydrolase [Janibacter indicus]SMC64818.1 Lysophospholipase, alpha-beta hydrolase superfamily [Janibacter indicus]